MQNNESHLGTTSCVILGLVSKRPMSGYDLAMFAARSIAHFWPISKSQVYAELPRLEDAGLIEGTHIEQGRRPDKRNYELTAAGERALDAWLSAPGYSSERTRNGLLAKFFFAERMTRRQGIELVTEYRDQADAYRRELQAVMDELEGRDDTAYGRATARYGLLHAEASVAWSEEVLKALNDSADLGREEDTIGDPGALRHSA